MGKLRASAEVEDTASLLYIPPVPNPNPNMTMVMIRGIDEDDFAYVGRGSWSIAGDDDDQGAGSYWYIDPPLPEKLVRSMHAYRGDHCDWDCGDPDQLRHESHLPYLASDPRCHRNYDASYRSALNHRSFISEIYRLAWPHVFCHSPAGGRDQRTCGFAFPI